MKKVLLFLILSSTLFFGCSLLKKKSVVEQFVDAYNAKDSIATFQLLHPDFVEKFEENIAIASKADYAKNYAWGKVMKDRMEFEVTNKSEGKIETIATYYSDRDSLLKIEPFKSVRIYFIKNNQILKIVETRFAGYEEYDGPRREKYSAFFQWLMLKHNVSPGDLKFDQKGAIDLRKYIVAYSETL